ncbi:J domain-containing protein [Noviherbaspirillum saxi]|uniref:J domain-containing protein n=1 Tax=Noviherbaspirillum saxi TaxID=2320863 RepID=A0A3A3FV64_9BURK|nr:J domain-containing protein [Noviherbaspirillum saxi]
MAQIHTHYDNLKVARNAPPEVIRAAYKTLSQKYHPDRNSDNPDAIRVIQIINSAYAVLSDPAKRREHDEWIARTEAQNQHSAAGIDGVDFVIGRTIHRKSRRSRHHSSASSFLSRRGHSHPILKMLQKAFGWWDHLGRKLFRKV